MDINKINYIEFYSTNLIKTKKFYADVFGWSFIDYGPTYAAIENVGIDGGIEEQSKITNNGSLVILYHSNLEEIRDKIIEHGGSIVIDIFEFPGGRRFQFTDGYSNELAIWSDN